jgi:type IV pilus assembly protein PilY1
VYYNPAITYNPPVNSTGAYYPNAPFTAAPNDGFNASSSTVDLSKKFRVGIYNDGSSSSRYSGAGLQSRGPAFYYKYTGSVGTFGKNYILTSSKFFTECNTAEGGSAPFTKVTVSATSGPAGRADERQNFANWYSYYRTRINMMKSGLGSAFSSLDSSYRVGFATMNNNGGSMMVNIAAFDSGQKSAWYDTVYRSSPYNGTGLIQALAKVGQMYANRLPDGTLNDVTATDPVQYSCQQNFTILSTDGFWNVAANDSSLSGDAVGNQDGGKATATGPALDSSGNAVAPHTITAARPYCDGSSTCGGHGASGSGTSDTLADVAMYYYENDLRTNALGNCSGALGNDVCTDNVPHNTADYANWHHMSLFTIGLGAPGYMEFDPNYQNETATSTPHDYYDVANGVASGTDSNGVHCPWVYTGSPYQSQPSASTGSPCEWPTPNASGIPSNIDDLWHAAVNGHGLYFSATDPSSLSAGLATALNAVNSVVANTASASTSTPNITTSSNFLFSSIYTSGAWSGDLSELTLDPGTGALITTTDPKSGKIVPLARWTAAAQLDTVTYSTRKIFFNKSGTLSPLTWTNLSPAQQANFTTPHISSLSQFCTAGPTCLSSTAQTNAAGAPLLNFILGDRSNEGVTNTNYFRVRTHVLGDIVDSSAAYVGPPPYQYADAEYSSFIAANSTRSAVFVGANDGMLHAFNGKTGAEMWAYVPTAVMPNLYALADKNYASAHRYFVDGSPVTGDVYFGGAWHTILVAGLNDGGKAYYALDITDPTSPSLLWEFTDANLGYSFGNPVITKLKNGTWVVLFASGYNNNVGGDGLGHLYVVNAQSGTIITGSTTVTSAGSTSSPSGLAMISAWADSRLVNNTSTYAYGGDMQGNLWRFDINGGSAPQLLVQLTDSSGNSQPITTIPELGSVDNTNTYTDYIIFVGTGSYLGVSDLTNTSQQSFYAIKDNLTSASGAALYPKSPQTNGSNFVQQTLTLGTCPSTPPAGVCTAGQSVVVASAVNPVDFSLNNGWYINLPTTGERDNTNATLVLGTIVFNTNIPASTACSAGGSSFEYFLDYKTGSFVSPAATSDGNGIVGVSLGSNLTSGTSVVQSLNGNTSGMWTQSGGGVGGGGIPLNGATGTIKRVGWHETN